jgi:uncharacterized membrane protein YhhN
MLYLALAFSAVNSVLAFAGQNDIQVYFILNLMAYLIITLLYVYLNPRARGALTAVNLVFFAGFGVIVVIKIINIIKT